MLAADLRPEYHFPFPHKLDAIFRQFGQLPVEDPQGMAFLQSMAPWIAGEIEPKLLASLKRSVKKVAWKIGLITWIKVRKRIRNLKKDRSKQIDEYNKKYVEHVVKFVMRNLKET